MFYIFLCFNTFLPLPVSANYPPHAPTPLRLLLFISTGIAGSLRSGPARAPHRQFSILPAPFIRQGTGSRPRHPSLSQAGTVAPQVYPLLGGSPATASRFGDPAAPPAPRSRSVSARHCFPGGRAPPTTLVAPPRPGSAPGRRRLIGLRPLVLRFLSSPSPNGHHHLVQKFPRRNRGALQAPSPAGLRGPLRLGAERGG